MELIKAFYSKEKGGYLLFMPDGAMLPCIQRVVVDDQWDGHDSGGRVSITVTIQAKVINEMPAAPFVPGSIQTEPIL